MNEQPYENIDDNTKLETVEKFLTSPVAVIKRRIQENEPLVTIPVFKNVPADIYKILQELNARYYGLLDDNTIYVYNENMSQCVIKNKEITFPFSEVKNM